MLKCYLRHRMADCNIKDIQQLMEVSGVSRNAINKLFRGENVESTKVETLIRLCNTFGCKLSDLVEYIPDKD